MGEENLPVVETKLRKDTEPSITLSESIFDESTLKETKKIEVDEQRRKDFSETVHLKEESIYFDFSKTHVSDNEYKNLLNDLKFKKLQEKVNDMFLGKPINFTENRAVLHTLLRDHNILEELLSEKSEDLTKRIKTEGNNTKECCESKNKEDEDDECKEECKCKHENCNCHTEQENNKGFTDEECNNCSNKEDRTKVKEELVKIRDFCEKIHSGKIKSSTNKKFKYIVNIGIGGSDLGPKVVCESLESYKIKHLKCYFVSNIDPLELYNTLSKVKVEETLFVVVSKTFTTLETMCNARLALKMASKLLKKSEKIVSDKHFIAVSSNLEEVTSFGISKIFAMWDFVGGRYSLWSAAGISIALYIGFDNFLKLLYGASVMDKHFKLNALKSACTMHSLIEVYYTLLNYNNKCIVPYDYYLRNLYLHLQQLDMESNGKSVKENKKFTDHSGMIIWGGVGTNSQHSFFQLLHQGTHKILTEFIYTLKPELEFFTDGSHHTKLLSNCLAQAEALRKGAENEDPHKLFKGNKPSITIRLSKLTPETLGALIAHYEHKVFVSGIFFGINSFDQFGVQLGKTIATKMNDVIDGKTTVDHEKCGCSASSIYAVDQIIESKKKK